MAVGPDTVQLWGGAIAALCAAVLGLASVLGGAYVMLPKGQRKIAEFVHGLTGAKEALEKVELIAVTVTGLAADVGTIKQSLGEARMAQESIQRQTDENHDANQRAISAVREAQERTAVALRTFVDEHMIEASQRDEQIRALSDSALEISRTLKEVAERCEQHSRSRSKHPSRKAASA